MDVTLSDPIHTTDQLSAWAEKGATLDRPSPWARGCSMSARRVTTYGIHVNKNLNLKLELGLTD